MKFFTMCPACQKEYDDPINRRFHAQPNACPACGPHLELWERSAGVPPIQPRALARDDIALLVAAEAVRRGQIVAVKGIGGFHLMVDARNDKAVRRLRERKQREEKPFALMFPSLESVKTVCQVSPLEECLLRSPEAPIVLLRRRKSEASNLKFQIADGVAPHNPNLGVMLSSNPLHHLLMAELNFPVVATSGNLSDEPICTDEHDALGRLHDIADVFLVHNRPIIRHVDDSIVRVMLDRKMVLRRARGYAPLPITLKTENRNAKSGIFLAVGAHLKNSIALNVGDQVFLSQHIGDLETEQAHSVFRRVIAAFEKLYDARPEVIVADLHPDYLSTKFAEEVAGRASSPLPAGMSAPRSACSTRVGVQHHIAHVLSCMAENEIETPVLGVSWDGTGYGLDGTIWGGEFFFVAKNSVERVAHFRPFQLPGGDAAVKEPRRGALGLLYEMFGESVFDRKELLPVAAFSPIELAVLKGMLLRKLNSPLCCSIGRLFDAVASLVNLRQQIRFEGQAATELEFALEGIETDERYDLPLITHHPSFILDWSEMIETILADVKRGVSTGRVSAKFHNALAETVVTVARRFGEPRVALSGGCFQNRYLTERIVTRLREEKFQPYWHQRVPPNDGGIALGQIVAAQRELNSK
jgi:hydrogenase maturation protein HypF